MLRIRDDQLYALKAPALEDFVDEMVLHVHEFFPDECVELGPDAIRGLVEKGIEKAASFGIVSPRGVCKYINMIMAFGADFDTKPETAAWALPILRDESIPDPNARMDVLSERALSVLEEAEQKSGEPGDEPPVARSA